MFEFLQNIIKILFFRNLSILLSGSNYQSWKVSRGGYTYINKLNDKPLAGEQAFKDG